MIRGDTVAGVLAGMMSGYTLWLVAISIGNAATTVSRWSVLVLVLSGVFAACTGAWAWRLCRKRRYLWAGFALGLPLLPVVLTLAVLTDTYL